MSTVPRQFRLDSQTITALDFIKEHLTKMTRTKCSRTDAVQFAAQETAALLRKTGPKKTSRNPK